MARHGDWAKGGDVSSDWAEGDLGCDVTGGKRFCGAPLFEDGGFVRGCSATAQRLTRGRSTAAIPPISRTLKLERFGGGAARPPLICGAGDPTVGDKDEATVG